MAVIKHFHQLNEPIAGEGGLPPPKTLGAIYVQPS